MAVALAVVLTAGAAWLPATGQAQHTKLSLESIGPDGGNGAQSAELVGALSVGKRSFIRTAEPLVSSDSDSSLDVYERTGGSTTLVSTGPTGGNGAFPVNFGAAVEAGQTVVFQTEEQLTAADTDGSMDVYRRAGTVTTLVSTGPTGGNGPLDSYLVAADEGGTHVFFTTREALVGSDSDASLDIYERSGGTTTLVSTGSGGGNGDQSVELMDISDDGQTAVFETTESLVASDTDTMQDVYARSAGTTTLVSTGPVGGNGSSHATFNGLSANGSKIFFSTDEPMVAADTDASQDVYERSGGTTIIHSIGSTGGNGGAARKLRGVLRDGVARVHRDHGAAEQRRRPRRRDRRVREYGQRPGNAGDPGSERRRRRRERVLRRRIRRRHACARAHRGVHRSPRLGRTIRTYTSARRAS